MMYCTIPKYKKDIEKKKQQALRMKYLKVDGCEGSRVGVGVGVKVQFMKSPLVCG